MHSSLKDFKNEYQNEVQILKNNDFLISSLRLHNVQRVSLSINSFE